MSNENNSSAPLKTAEGAPVAQWQKRHPDEEGGAWQNTTRGDAMWWRDNSQGWEIRPLYEAAPQAVAAQAPAAQAPAAVAVPEITDAMVDAYLAEQRRTVEEADRFGRSNIGGLHTNTVREACGNGLRAALAATPKSPATEDSSTGDQAEPSPQELMDLSNECKKLPGGMGMHYLNYAKAVLARWGTAPQAQAEVQAEPVAPATLPPSLMADLREAEECIAHGLGRGVLPKCDKNALTGVRRLIYWAKSATAPQAQPADALTQAARDVLAERRRQVEVEGFSFARDDSYTDGELAQAAACYAASSQSRDISYMAHLWPWPNHSWKPGTTRGDLVKAGALILAELERINRARAAMAAAQEGSAA